MGEPLPLEQQDKRGEAHIEPHSWRTWLEGDVDEAKALLVAPPSAFYDQNDADLMNDMLAGQTPPDAVTQAGLLPP